MDSRFEIEGRLAIIGGGRMGEAIVRGLVGAGVVDAQAIVVAEPDPVRRDELRSGHGVRVVEDGSEAVRDADIVLLAVKPQLIDEVVSSLADSVPRDALVVSIAAGVTSRHLESMLAPDTAVVRVMPNTPAMVGEAMSVVSGGSSATPQHVDLVRAVFASLGEAVVLDERHQDAATAISGSGPAYMALVIHALASAGAEQGLPHATAQALAVQTMRGTAELLDQTGQSPEALIEAVSSPGGTTVAALGVLEKHRLGAAFAEAVAAAVARARELGR